MNINVEHVAVNGFFYPLNVAKIATFGEIEFDLPITEYIPDHARRALKLLIEQFDGDVNFDEEI